MHDPHTPPSNTPHPAWPAPAPQPRYTAIDKVTACLFAVAITGALIGVAESLRRPEHGIITALTYSSSNGPACTYIGRIMTCTNHLDDLGADDALGNEFANEYDLDSHGCHQVAFRSPTHWFTGYDCVSEEQWDQLDIGDTYTRQ
ncbi:hypothetical protein LO763_22305 [Glycomyces sp. A-F 0318]|uniref:hypothetical protein n=1 Tax=Glycomyces amatae TaxID=2881355 RepID=UPI001E3B8F24|nr:hypothetical protein [Glycomyces amatae]MCD0446351.1 hypothetical protein [Glycomyces amatae]